jgi:lysophospholipase L1-like esterase
MTFTRRKSIKTILGSLLMLSSPELFAREYKAEVKVINAGIGGNNTIDLLKRLETDCLSHHPDLVIIMVGTNDALNSFKSVSDKDYEANLNSLVKKINQAGSKVLLLTIPPIYEPYLLLRHPASFYGTEGPTVKRNKINEIIKSVSTTNHTYFLDTGGFIDKIGKVGVDKDSLIRNVLNSNNKDGVHPTATGYRFIALSIFNFISSQKQVFRSIVCYGDSITFGDGSIDKESYPSYLKKLLN